MPASGTDSIQAVTPSEPAAAAPGLLDDVGDVDAVCRPSRGGEGGQPVRGLVEELICAEPVPAGGVG